MYEDPRDTPQQRAALRLNRHARKVRETFPPGTRVMGAPGHFGRVERHIPSLTSLGGSLVVRWDSGHTGRTMAFGLTVVPEPQPLDGDQPTS